MRRLLKYLVLVVVVVSVIGGTIRMDYQPAEDSIEKTGLYFIGRTPLESDLCFSRQHFTTPPTQMQVYDRKTDFIHQHNFEFVKEGNVCNVRTNAAILIRYINRHASLTEPAHMLALLRRLII